MDTSNTLIAAAQWLGTHALGGFFLLHAALLLAAAAAFALLRRIVVPRDGSTLPPAIFIAVRLAVGFAVVVAMSMAFAELAEELGTEQDLQRFDDAFMDAMGTAVPPAAVRVFAFVTRLGDPPTLVVLAALVAAALAWRGRRRMALAWLLTLGGNALLNPALKAVFERVRPVHDHALVAATGFSFPSGHSSGAVVAYGMLAYVLVRRLPPRWHLPLVLGAASIAYAVGCSRIFLRVHYPSDVMAGFASGAAWLAVCIASVEGVRHYRRRTA